MKLTKVCTALLCLSLLIPTALADDDPSKDDEASAYVEVTTSRLPEDPEDTPASITIVTGEELRARGATDLRSALFLVAGVDVAPGGDGGPASAVPEMWGLREFDAFLLVIDGVPWGGAFVPDLPTLTLVDVERIEVLRGAAPVTYGATSFIGVIHVIHRAPGAEGGEASLALATHSGGAASLALPLPDLGSMKGTLDVDYRVRNYDDEDAGFDKATVMWRNQIPMEDGRFRFDLSYFWVDQEPSSPHPRQGPELSDLVPLDANHNPDGAFIENRRLLVNLGYDHDLEHGQWNTLLSLSQAEIESFRGFLTTLDETSPNARGFEQEVELFDAYFDTHVACTKMEDLTFLAGFDHLHGSGEAEAELFDYTVGLDGSGKPGKGDVLLQEGGEIEDRRDFSGLYGLVEWRFAEAVRLEAGVRLNHTRETKKGEAEASGGEEEIEEERERNDTRASGVLGLSWTAWEHDEDDVTLYVAYRDAFKPAVAEFEVGEEEGGEGEGEELLEAETARSLEVGVKGRLDDGKFMWDLDFFRMDFENLVVANSEDGLPGLENAGEERFQGAELEASCRFPHDLVGHFAYAYHDAKFRDYVQDFDGTPTQLSGKRLEMSANSIASVGLLLAPEHGLTGRLEAHYVGSRFLNKRNTALAEAYTELAAGIGYRFDRWDLRAIGENLTDERDPVAESELGDAQYYRLPGRHFEVEATFHF